MSAPADEQMEHSDEIDVPESGALEGAEPALDAEGVGARRLSPSYLAFRRYRRNWLSVAGAFVLFIMLAVSFLLPLVVPLDPTGVDLLHTRQPPGDGHLLGTDANGRDVFSRLVYAGRISMGVGVTAAVLSSLLGALLGAVAGAFGGWVDIVIMRTADTFLSFPQIVVVVVLAGIFGPGVLMLIIGLGLFGWPTAGRMVRSIVLTMREREFVQASRAAGARPGWIIRKHLLPAALSQLVVVFTLAVAGCILAESGLSFLGLGVQPPTASWGNMLKDAQSLTVISTMPWLWIPPGVAIAATVLSVNFIGDGLRDAADPRQR